ncbi:cytosine permease [Evansella sp. LMS18]|uniref:purine-cytosine permease family protein n=1 Tax=Evansella sp. LMS18 TaxID=2924033 RepID=UPI0020D02D44|nr:cytosine permease [Evansella sp. LMS18]UTR09965.1 cytosine permease [Evansella sp. LMS18]
MAQLVNQFGNDNIRPTPKNERTMGFFSTFALWLAANVVITSVLTGMFFVPDLPWSTAIWVIIIGSAIGAIPLALTGRIGTRTGLSTMVMTRAAFGQRGAILPSIVNTVVLIGWSWIQAYLAGLSLNYAVSFATGYSNIPLFVILTQFLVVGITIYGHRKVEGLEKIVSIGMLLLSTVVFFQLFTRYEVGSLITMQVAQNPEISAIIAFDIVVATAFSWMSSVCDFNRYAKSETKAMAGTYLGYILASLIAMGLGATVSGFSILAGMEQTYDPTLLLAQYGFGFVAAVVVFLSVVSTNVMALYSASMSFMNIFSKVSFWKPVAAIGVITILGALLQEALMASFFDFILLIATLFIPIFAIVLVDFFIIKKGNYDANDIVEDTKGLYQYQNGINISAYIAYVLGAAFAYVFTYVAPLNIGSSILTFFVSGIIYWAAMKLSNQIPEQPDLSKKEVS